MCYVWVVIETDRYLYGPIKYTFSLSKKGGFRPYRREGIKVINILASIFGQADIAFSVRHNRKYGIGEFLTLLMAMSSRTLTAESASGHTNISKNAPVGKWFRNMMHSITQENADKLCMTLLTRSMELKNEIENLKNKRIYVAIDKHLIPRHDIDNMDSLVHSKRKNGTGKFEAYATIHAVAGKINAALDCYRFVYESINIDFVRQFVHMLDENDIKSRLLLLDREFYAVDIMKELNGLKKKFLMPAVKNSAINKAIREYHSGKRKAVSRFTIKNKCGMSFTFTLIIKKATKPKRVDKNPRYKTKKTKYKKPSIESRYVAFATNISLQQAIREVTLFPKQYRLRWGIETAYRQIEEIRPRTTSRDVQYRMILFYTGLFMYNMWAIARIQKNVETKEMTLRFIADVVYMILLVNVGKDIQFPIDPGGPG